MLPFFNPNPNPVQGAARRHWATWLFAVALVAGCGGGGGDAASGAGTSFAQGPITGFGSVIVNGVRFDDSSASVVDDDDTSHNRSELKLGMQVEVDGSSIDKANASARATHIRFGSEIVGPAADINPAAGTFTVLSQTVVVTPTTVFDDSLAGGLAVLTAGTVVEVHAQFDAATQTYRATRIEAEPGAIYFKLRGVVSALTATTFKIGDAVINYAGIAAGDLPPNFADGLKVRVRLNTTQVNGEWVAVTIRTGVRKVEDHDEAEVRGTITDWTSATQFSVNGLPVDATNAAFPDGTAGVVLGARVEVEGAVKDGVLIARKVELEDNHANDDDHRPELHGVISNLKTGEKTFTLREMTVSYDDSTVFANGSVADLADGVSVEVKGVLGSDRTSVAATRIEFKR